MPKSRTDLACHLHTMLLAALVGIGACCTFSAAAAADIAVGIAGPMSGQYAPFGEQMKRGAEMAVADINAAGGVLGQKLVLTVGDDGCEVPKTVAVANQMVSSSIKFMAGHFCSGSSIAASSIYEQNSILQISPASTNPKFTDEGGWNVARLCARDDAQGTVAGKFIARKYSGKKIAIVNDNAKPNKALGDRVREALNAAGGKEAFNETYAPDGKDYSALVDKITASVPDVVYIAGSYQDVGLILKELRERGSTAQLISGDALVTDEFWAVAGEAGEGTLMTFAADPQSFPAVAELVKRFKEASYNPEGATLYTYATLQAYKQAAEAVGSTDARKMAEWLRNGNTLKTVIGEIALNQKGDVKEPRYVWYVWHDGKYAEESSTQ
jgi:branched-chain amino acid transport system substrate-binding protein